MAETFTVVLDSCDSAKIEQVTVAMASAFPIRKEMALQLASSAPIAILSDLSQLEANAAYAEMEMLIEAGAVLNIVQTDQLGSAVSKVKWPERPTINGITIEELAQEAQMEAEGGGEVITPPSEQNCPHCGNVIRVIVDGSGGVFFEAGGAPAGTDSGVMPPPPADAGDDFILSNDDLIAEIEEPHIPKTEEITSVLDSLLPEDFGEGVGIGGTPALEAVPNPAPPPPPGPPTQQTIPQVPVQANQEPMERKETVDDQKLYNVFLPKLSTDDKKEKAIPLMVELAGITNDEANKLANRIVIPLVKGIAKARADEIKERFMSVGILPRIRQQV
ncbi:hypothetical protein ACFL6F_01200 [Planctomycetota bacterium]